MNHVKMSDHFLITSNKLIFVAQRRCDFLEALVEILNINSYALCYSDSSVSIYFALDRTATNTRYTNVYYI
jgi:hypothetical protein